MIRILAQTCLVSFVLTLNSCSQTPYDNDLISDGKGLNLTMSTKRGVKGGNGIVYFVQNDGLTLTAYNGSKIKWIVNVVNPCKVAALEKSAILGLYLVNDHISLALGKGNYARVDIQDGKTKYRCAGKNNSAFVPHQQTHNCR